MVEGGKTYRIKNVKGGTVLDLSAGDSRSGASALGRRD